MVSYLNKQRRRVIREINIHTVTPHASSIATQISSG